MKLQISTGDLPLEGTVRTLGEKRLGSDLEKVLRHFPEDVRQATVHVSKRSRHGYKATFEMQLPGLRVFSEEKHDDFPTLMTRLRDEVKRQIRKHKEKLVEK